MPPPSPAGPGDQHIQTFILKVANRCNIDCDYCYVFNSADDAWRRLPARMSIDVAAATARRITEHITAHGLRSVDVIIHGGEPLLAGAGHLDRLLETVSELAPPGVAVRFGLQTNATLMSEKWLDVFERHRVTVGVSLDGPPGVNDRHRLSHGGRPTTGAALRGLEVLRSRPGLFGGLLAVVDLVADPAEVHDYLSSFRPPMIDFNLPHATHDHPPPRRDPSVPEYGIWLSRVHDRWSSRPDHQHTVRLLEDILALSLGVRGSVESLGLAPAGIVVVESDGSIESIDTLRAVEKNASWLGLDVFRHGFDAVLLHPKIRRRIEGIGSLSATCQECAFVKVCGGGYLPHRFSKETGYLNPSVYCADLMYLIRHVQSSFERMPVTADEI
jgi:uncharacterized protein